MRSAASGRSGDSSFSCKRPLLQRLQLYYGRVNPTKLGSLDAIAAVWSSREEDLFRALRSKYGVEPPSEEGWSAIEASVNSIRAPLSQPPTPPPRAVATATATVDAAAAAASAELAFPQEDLPRQQGRLMRGLKGLVAKRRGGAQQKTAATASSTATEEAAAPRTPVLLSSDSGDGDGDALAPFDSQVLRPVDIATLERSLPVWQQGNDWRLLYSLQQHGSHIGTFIERVKRSNPTLIALLTENGEVCGAYASEAWKSTTSFCGDGETFLFSCGKRRRRRGPQGEEEEGGAAETAVAGGGAAGGDDQGSAAFQTFRWCVRRVLRASLLHTSNTSLSRARRVCVYTCA